MEERKIGYALQPIVEGAVISNSIKCNLPISQHQLFILAKRNELVFFEINEKGIHPIFKIPFTKQIARLRLINGKSINKQYDLILCFFHDYSFIAFSDPQKIEFRYQPPNIPDNPFYISETHEKLPILFTFSKSGQLSYWNPLNEPNKMYNIHVPDDIILDLKFLQHQTIRIAMLMQKNTGKKFIKVFTFDETLLELEEISNLGVITLIDPTTSFLIPLAHGSHEKPVYLAIGTNTIGVVYKSGIVNVDSPFLESPPLCYYRIGRFAVIIATQNGSLYLLQFSQTLDITKIGNLPIIPTSITNIDGNIFYFGSSFGNSVFAQITETTIDILQVLPQFIPVKSFSTFSENIGSIFLAQGNQQLSCISEFKTGSKFTPLIEIEAFEIESIFSACNHFIICSKFDNSSVCIELKTCELITNDSFISNSKTLNVLERDANSFIQICSQMVQIVDFSDGYQNSLKFDSTIIDSCCDHANALILFSDHCIILTKNLEIIDQIEFGNNQACACSLCNDFISISFYSSEVHVFRLKNDQIYIENVKDDEIITFLRFIVYKNDLLLFAFSESGRIIRYLVENKENSTLTEIGYIQIGYLTKNVIRINVDNEQNILNNVMFINGSSPMLLYPNGSFVPILMDSPSASCSIVNNYFAIFSHMKLTIGSIDNSDVCSIKPKEVESNPRLFSIHKDPLSLFVLFEKSALFTVSAFLLPSFSDAYTQHFESNETVECFYYHDFYQTTFIGSIINSNKSRIFAVKQLFNELKQICEFDIDEPVCSMSSSYSNNLIVGSKYMLHIFQVESLFNGLLKITKLQTLSTDIIPKSISVFNHFLLCFGETKYIVTFEENDEHHFTKYENITHASTIHSGFIWRPFTTHSCRVITIENERTLAISSFKFKDNTVTTKVLTTYELESPVLSFHPVRDGFALLTTKNGSLYTLEEYDLGHIAMFNKITSEISLLFPFAISNSKILDTTTLNMFFYLPIEIQDKIAKTVKKDIDEVKEFIQSFYSNLPQLCST